MKQRAIAKSSSIATLRFTKILRFTKSDDGVSSRRDLREKLLVSW